MTPKQRKDYVANCLLSEGVNKTSIIAICCNAVTESAHTFDPKLTEYGRQPIFSNSYAFGCGIWQWSFLSNGNKTVYDYARSHSEQDAIKMQCHKLVSEPQQWISYYLPSRLKMTFSDFLHNTKKLSWQDLTFAWCYGWERPYDTTTSQHEGISRQNNYSWVMPINWSASSGGNDSGNGNQTNKPTDNGGDEAHKNRQLSMSECLSLLNKLKPVFNDNDNQEGNNNNGSNQGGSAGASNAFDKNLCISEFNQHQSQTIYALDGRRSHIWTDWSYSDCSAFVSRMVIDGWHLTSHKGELYNTETLHGFLKSIGYKLVSQSYSTNRPAQHPGDVYIMGQIGTSLGSGGHALISLDGVGMWECQGSRSPALKHTATTSEALKWDAYGWNPLIYQYTKA